MPFNIWFFTSFIALGDRYSGLDRNNNVACANLLSLGVVVHSTILQASHELLPDSFHVLY